MKQLYWHLLGDTVCLLSGGEDNATFLQQLGAGNVQARLDDDGADGVPGAIDAVAYHVAQHPGLNRVPDLQWTASDWPAFWRLRFYDPAGGDAEIVLDPGGSGPAAVYLPWPPDGWTGPGGLDLKEKPAGGDVVEHALALLESIDLLITDPGHRADVEAARIRSGSYRAVDVLPLLWRIDPDLGGPKAPPDSLSLSLNDAMTTIHTWIGITSAGGVHVEIGWQPETTPVGNALVTTREFPCGAFRGPAVAREDSGGA